MFNDIADHTTRRAQDVLRPYGVPAALIAAKPLPDAAALDRARDAAQRLQALRTRMLPAAQRLQQCVGLELECLTPQRSRDAVYELLYQHLGAFATTLHTDADAAFQLAPGERFYPLLIDEYQHDGQPLTIERFRGHGGVMVTIRSAAGPQKHTLAAPPTVFAAHAALPSVIGAERLAAATLVRRRCLLLTKDTTGDTAKLELRAERMADGALHATLTGINGTFYTPDAAHPFGNPALGGQLESIVIPLGRAAESSDYEALLQHAIARLEPLISNAVLMRKRDAHTGITLAAVGPNHAPDTLRIGYEEGDALEVITPVLTLADRAVVRQVVGGMQALGFVGTRPDLAIGMHEHLDVPLHDADGHLSSAPFRTLLAAYLEYRDDFAALIPRTPIREPYIQPLPDVLIDRVHTVHAHGDARNPADIVALLCDIVRFTQGKYHECNSENYVAAMTAQIVDSGALAVGASFDVTRGGVRYRATATRDARTGAPNIAYRIDEANALPLARMATGPTAPITTIELRFPDTLIDPDSVVYIMELGACLAASARV